MNDLKILFKLTTRERPDNAITTLKSIYRNVSSSNYDILVTLDADDETAEQLHFRITGEKQRPYPNIHFRMGLSKNKIDAINRDVNEFTFKWDILVNVSDDQVFTEKGFDNDIRSAFLCKDNEVGDDFELCLDTVVHFPDNHRQDLMTMSIIGYDAYKRDNYIYNPEYFGQFCDNEAQVVAQKRGIYKFIDKVIFNHNHPNYIGGDRDNLYKRYDALFNKDYETFTRRQANNFYL